MNRNLDCKYLMVISEQRIFTASNQYNFKSVTRKNFQCQYYPATNSPDKTPYCCYIKKMQPLGCIFLLGYPDSNQE